MVEAHEALTGAEGIRFIGNLEGRDLLSGEADVIVTDGFTGNVTLKTLEGTARAVADAVRAAARSGPLPPPAVLLLRPALGGLRRSMDPNSVGGAILLGLRGVAVVAHGSSTPGRHRERGPARRPSRARAGGRAHGGAARGRRSDAGRAAGERALRDG